MLITTLHLLANGHTLQPASLVRRELALNGFPSTLLKPARLYVAMSVIEVLAVIATTGGNRVETGNRGSARVIAE